MTTWHLALWGAGGGLVISLLTGWLVNAYALWCFPELARLPSRDRHLALQQARPLFRVHSRHVVVMALSVAGTVGVFLLLRLLVPPRYGIVTILLAMAIAFPGLALGNYAAVRHGMAQRLRQHLVDRRQALCVGCGYALSGLSAARCPECGHPFDRSLLQRSESPFAEPVTITIELDTAQLRALFGEYWRRTCLPLFGLLLTAFLSTAIVLVARGHSDWTVGVFGALAVSTAVVLWLTHQSNVRAPVQLYGTEPQPLAMTLRFTSDALEVTSTLGTRILPWHHIVTVQRMPRAWWLTRVGNEAFMVPTAVLGDGLADRFEEHLARFPCSDPSTLVNHDHA